MIKIDDFAALAIGKNSPLELNSLRAFIRPDYATP
jgi:hypothetical protein